MLRRMSLTGDAMSHAILPGVAVGFLVFGLDLVPMTVGGLIAGLVVAFGAGAISRLTIQREDASLAAFYLISLALGVLIVSLRGSSVDLMHVLFGSVLGLTDEAILVISVTVVASLISLAVFWRALVAECLDPIFLRSVSRLGPAVHFVFLAVVVLNLVGGFLALGTLLSVGLMMLPAAAARFWTQRVETMALVAIFIAMTSSVSGLLVSYHAAPALRPRHRVERRRRLCRLPCFRDNRNSQKPHHQRSSSYSLKEILLKALTPALMLAALALAPLPALADPLKVVASFSVIGDFAEQVGGDRIALTTLVGANGDIHVYEPTPADAVAMSKADVVLVNGLALEGFLDRLVAASGSKAPLIELSDGIDPIANGEDEDHDHEGDADDHDHEQEDEDHDHADEDGHHHHGAFDPHAWQSVANAEIYVKNVEAAFCAADPDGCETYSANAAAYLDALSALDDNIHAMMDAIPADKRTVITSHDAFAYFGSEYGLKFLSPQGVSTDAEPSAADVATLIRQIRDAHAAAIFTENVSDPRVIEQIAMETGVNVGGELYALLSGPDAPAADYVEMMRHNAETISAAIQGD